MKLNKLALAVVATVVAPITAMAGVTVSPVLLGYHYYPDDTHDKQRDTFRTARQVNEGVGGVTSQTNLARPNNGGVAFTDDLYTGAAIGVELTPATQFQVEYGVTNSDVQSAKESWNKDARNRFDGEETMLTGNFLVGFDQFTGYNNNKFKPYVLIGAGQAKYKVENQAAYQTHNNGAEVTQQGQSGNIAAGTTVAKSTDTIGNLGLGARYLVSDAVALRGEVRAIHNFDNKWWEGLAMAGLEVTLGGRLGAAAPVVPVTPEPPVPVVDTYVPPVVAEPPVVVDDVEDVVLDSDMDGVPDHLDMCQGTARNLVVDARGCPVQIDVEDALRMELRVFFDRDKSAIKPQFRNEVAKVAERMHEYPNATATIEGHASKDSNRSNAKYNQRLSEARANAVKSMLTNEFGIAPNRLSAIGYGFDRPIAPNTTEEGRVQNRRVYAVIEGSKVTTINQTK